MKISKRILVRSRSLVNDRGKELWKYNWTEVIYFMGIILWHVQINNLSYREASKIFDERYKIKFPEREGEHLYETLTYKI